MSNQTKASSILLGLSVLFLALFAGFLLRLWGRPAPLPAIPLVDPSFTSNTTARVSYAQLLATGGDVSDFDCYGCHERNKPPPLRFDDQHNLIVPKEHSDVVMHHGTHNRNNLCFNCHDENNLERFQTRDGRELKLAESTPLCGSCHGPTYRDWEAGAHGRTSGYWNRQLGPITRQDCVSCHNPHSPKFPSRQPAPGPHPLRPGPQRNGHTALELPDSRRGTKQTLPATDSPRVAGAPTVPSPGPFVLRLFVSMVLPRSAAVPAAAAGTGPARSNSPDCSQTAENFLGHQRREASWTAAALCRFWWPRAVESGRGLPQSKTLRAFGASPA